MSLGMFSIIPVPKNSWNEKHMPLIIPCLPLVGLLIGLVWYGTAHLLHQLSTPQPIQNAAVLFAPMILTGFIHIDGYMDTADAVFSRADLETKKRILKDPKAGAFAVIAIAGMILFQYSAIQTIIDAQKTYLTFAFIPPISRCAAGIAMLRLKPVFETGYNVAFRKNTKPRHTVFICITAAIILTTAWFALRILALPLLAGTLAGTLATLYLYKQFKGMSGDLCGCVITIGELAALLCMAIVP